MLDWIGLLGECSTLTLEETSAVAEGRKGNHSTGRVFLSLCCWAFGLETPRNLLELTGVDGQSREMNNVHSPSWKEF